LIDLGTLQELGVGAKDIHGWTVTGRRRRRRKMNNATTERGRQLAVAAPADQTVEEEQKLQESEADSKETRTELKKGRRRRDAEDPG
jgi:hypothetical protein